MPIPLLASGLWSGVSTIPYAYTVIKVALWVLIISLLKYYFGGARNSSERVMHSKVVMVTVSVRDYYRTHVQGDPKLTFSYRVAHQE